MNNTVIQCTAALLAALAQSALASDLSLESAPPVVVRTVPEAGAIGVDPALKEIRATFSKPMQDGSWSWSTWGEENFPEMTGQPRYEADRRTSVLPVKLQPGRLYATWLNSYKFNDFKDTNGRPAVPYLLTFRTADSGAATAAAAQSPGPDDAFTRLLNDDQRAVLEWTDRQFRSFFDARTFDGWSIEERAKLEQRLMDALNGPRSIEYYHAINTLAVLRSTNALPQLRAIAFERVDRNNRDRWMSIRALGLIGDKAAVPDLIHLVYHGNVNTHWWAQLSLVRLTGMNFGKDWNRWGQWWTESGGQPPYNPVIIRWWNGQSEPAKLAESLDEADRQVSRRYPA